LPLSVYRMEKLPRHIQTISNSLLIAAMLFLDSVTVHHPIQQKVLKEPTGQVVQSTHAIPYDIHATEVIGSTNRSLVTLVDNQRKR
jgi:hypothetical protein